MQPLPPYCPDCVMPDDAPQPARKSCRLGERRQAGPCGDKSLLHNILGLLKIPDLGQRRAEREVLEALRQVDEGLEIALPRPANQIFVIHYCALSPERC